MRARVDAIVADLKDNPPPLPVGEIAEADPIPAMAPCRQFHLPRRARLSRRRAGAGTGFQERARHHALARIAGAQARQRAARVHAGDHGVPQGAAAADHRQGEHSFARAPSRLSRLHRREAVRCVRQAGRRASASSACSHRLPIRASAHSIPYLRRKIAAVEARAGFDPGSHSGKALANVLEHYPRDELFQIDEDTLTSFALAILQLDERPRVRVLARRDRFDRFVSVLVFVPRERYDSDIRAKIGDYLASAFIGRVSAFYPFFPGRAAGARAFHHRPVRRRRIAGHRPRDAGTRSRGDRPHLDRRAEPTRSHCVHPPDKARELFDRYRDAFSRRLPRGLCAGGCGRRHPRDRRTVRANGRSASISTTVWRKSSARSA